jgi:hypothetical protein
MTEVVPEIQGEVAAPQRKRGIDNVDRLQRETEAARILREQLADLMDGDEIAIRDTIEGETNLHELIASVAEDIATDEASVAGIKAHIETMKARKERLERRIEFRRSAILNAMSIGEVKKLELAIATLSRKPVPPKVQIVNEAEIPSQFWKRADPTLDKKAIADALKNNEQVPGATLSNGGETLAVKWS